MVKVSAVYQYNRQDNSNIYCSSRVRVDVRRTTGTLISNFSGANGDREKEKKTLCSADHKQDGQPYPVDPYSAISDDYINYQRFQHFISNSEPRSKQL